MAAPAASPDSRFSRVRQRRNSPGTGRTDRENREASARLAPISPLDASGSQSVSTGATVYDLYRAISFVWSGNRLAKSSARVLARTASPTKSRTAVASPLLRGSSRQQPQLPLNVA